MTPIEVPPIDPRREQALLDAFDAHWAHGRPVSARRSWIAAAALTAVVVALNWAVASNRPDPDPVQDDEVTDLEGFVPWPGTEGWPPLESGSLVRVDLPVTALPTLGLTPPASPATVVQADIVIGQDGFARAVRFVQR